MKEIPLSRGKVALVDDEDYERVSQFSWHARPPKGNSCFYAWGTLLIDGREQSIALHRFLMNPAPSQRIDHRDGDGLNCQRHNMRLATPTQNMQNRRKPAHTKSGYKGVRSQKSYWYVRIRINGIQKHFSGFTSAEDAARGYDRLAIKHFGEFANLNFPSESFK